MRGPVHVGVVEDAPLPEGAYDVVTMWDVIEHLPDPASTLRAVHSALRPGGVFAVTTMDVDALFPRVAGRFWPWYMQMHLVYFSRRTLGELLRRCGFEVVEVTRHRRIVRVSYAVSRLGTLQPRGRARRARAHAAPAAIARSASTSATSSPWWRASRPG